MTKNVFACPVCGCALMTAENVWKCEKGHCYDVSKKGYVNLLMSQKSSKKRKGDDKAMVAARREFLDKGYYEKLQKALVEAVTKHSPDDGVIIDAGCGEGYYTAAFQNAMPNAHVCGADISKDALIYARKRNPDIQLAVASASSLPFSDGCADIVMSVFAPVFPAEFSRILKSGGVLIRAVPLEEHLFGLKEAVYENAYKNPTESHELDGFSIIEKTQLKYTLRLSNTDDIQSLFMMTPYYYKTSREDQRKLLALESLETRLHFGIIIYKKSE